MHPKSHCRTLRKRPMPCRKKSRRRGITKILKCQTVQILPLCFPPLLLRLPLSHAKNCRNRQPPVRFAAIDATSPFPVSATCRAMFAFTRKAVGLPARRPVVARNSHCVGISTFTCDRTRVIGHTLAPCAPNGSLERKTVKRISSCTAESNRSVAPFVPKLLPLFQPV